MPLPVSVTLTGKWKVAHDGRVDSGPLVADERGIGVDVSVSQREGLKKLVTTRRHYFFGWGDVTGYDISAAQQADFAGTNLNADKVILTMKTAANQYGFTLKGTDVTRVRNQLGSFLAAVDARL